MNRVSRPERSRPARRCTVASRPLLFCTFCDIMLIDQVQQGTLVWGKGGWPCILAFPVEKDGIVLSDWLWRASAATHSQLLERSPRTAVRLVYPPSLCRSLWFYTGTALTFARAWPPLCVTATKLDCFIDALAEPLDFCQTNRGTSKKFKWGELLYYIPRLVTRRTAPIRVSCALTFLGTMAVGLPSRLLLTASASPTIRINEAFLLFIYYSKVIAKLAVNVK